MLTNCPKCGAVIEDAPMYQAEKKPLAAQTACELCEEPMPEGEEMFKFHGYSGPCPKPHADTRAADRAVELLRDIVTAGEVGFGFNAAVENARVFLTALAAAREGE